MATVHELNIPARKPARARREKLTEDVVKTIRRGERVYDVDVPGFFALGLSRGVSFGVLADVPTAARRWDYPKKTMVRTLGKWPDELSPKAARTLAGEYISKIKKGVDPAPKNAAARVNGWTIQEAFENYRDTYMARKGAKPESVRTYEMNYQRLPT